MIISLILIFPLGRSAIRGVAGGPGECFAIPGAGTPNKRLARNPWVGPGTYPLLRWMKRQLLEPRGGGQGKPVNGGGLKTLWASRPALARRWRYAAI